MIQKHEYLSEFRHDQFYKTILKSHPMWDGIHGLLGEAYEWILYAYACLCDSIHESFISMFVQVLS